MNNHVSEAGSYDHSKKTNKNLTTVPLSGYSKKLVYKDNSSHLNKGGRSNRLPQSNMKTITISSNAALNIKNRHQKFMKVCNLFNSRMEFEADNNVVDIKSNGGLIKSMTFDETTSLRITGDDETQAAVLIKECIGC